MKEMKFFDIVERKAFDTEDYEMKLVKGKRMAHTISPWGHRCVKIVGKNF